MSLWTILCTAIVHIPYWGQCLTVYNTLSWQYPLWSSKSYFSLESSQGSADPWRLQLPEVPFLTNVHYATTLAIEDRVMSQLHLHPLPLEHLKCWLFSDHLLLPLTLHPPLTHSLSWRSSSTDRLRSSWTEAIAEDGSTEGEWPDFSSHSLLAWWNSSGNILAPTSTVLALTSFCEHCVLSSLFRV